MTDLATQFLCEMVFVHVDLAYSVWFSAMETKTSFLINLFAILFWSTAPRNTSPGSLNIVANNQL